MGEQLLERIIRN